MTTKKKRFSENPLNDFYNALVSEDEGFLKDLHIPHSSVFHAREAYYNYTGHRVSLQRMEKAMLLEGMLTSEDCFV